MKIIVFTSLLMGLLAFHYRTHSMYQNYPLLYPDLVNQQPISDIYNIAQNQQQQAPQPQLDENRMRTIIQEELNNHEQRLLQSQKRIANESLTKVAAGTVLAYFIYKLYTKWGNAKNTSPKKEMRNFIY